MEALIEIDRLIETVVEHLEGVTVRMDAQAGTVHVDQRYHLAVLGKLVFILLVCIQ